MDGATVLIIEDNAITVMELIERIKDTGGKVVNAVSSVEKARQVLDSREDSLDLVLVDYHLADDGVGSEAVRMVNSHSPSAQTVLVSSLNPEVLEQKAENCNADAFVTKPLDYRELIRTIENLLGVTQ